jgi:hypothetical protein
MSRERLLPRDFHANLTEQGPAAVEDCAECRLLLLQARLQEPWGYDDANAADFTSLTSSCGVSTLTFATPTTNMNNS